MGTSIGLYRIHSNAYIHTIPLQTEVGRHVCRIDMTQFKDYSGPTVLGDFKHAFGRTHRYLSESFVVTTSRSSILLVAQVVVVVVVVVVLVIMVVKKGFHGIHDIPSSIPTDRYPLFDFLSMDNVSSISSLSSS